MPTLSDNLKFLSSVMVKEKLFPGEDISIAWPADKVKEHLEKVIIENSDISRLELAALESTISLCDAVQSGQIFEWFDYYRTAIDNKEIDPDSVLEYNDIAVPGVYTDKVAEQTYYMFAILKDALKLDESIVNTLLTEYSRHYEMIKGTNEPLLTAVIGCGEMSEIKEMFEKHPEVITEPTVVVGIDTSPEALARARSNFEGMENIVVEELHYPEDAEGKSLDAQIAKIKQRAQDEKINIVALLNEKAEVALESLKAKEDEEPPFKIISTTKAVHHLPKEAREAVEDILQDLTETYIQDDMFRAGGYRPEDPNYDSEAGRAGLNLLFQTIYRVGGVTMLHGGMVSMLKALGAEGVYNLARKLVGEDAQDIKAPEDTLFDNLDLPVGIVGRNATARILVDQLSIPTLPENTLLGSCTVIIDYNRRQQLMAA